MERMTTSGINRIVDLYALRQRGFTLLEMILVAGLIAISVAIGAPYFVRSIRGNRLQIAARTATMAARYARSMAVMRQQRFLLTANAGSDELIIAASRGAGTGGAVNDMEPGGHPFDDMFDDPIMRESAVQPAPAAPAQTPQPIRRRLEGVRIEGFRLKDGNWQTEGKLEVVFYPNGTCDAFDLRLQETAGRKLLIRVDELGAVRAVPGDGFD